MDLVSPTAAEVRAPMPGDDLIPRPDSTMDRAFTVPGPPDRVWPWIQQLGKRRAGWYLPHSVERLLPRGRRAVRHIDDRWQHLAAGDVIPDYGGRHETFTVTTVEPPNTLVYTSRRGRTDVSWSISLSARPGGTRVQLRLRLGPLRRPWLANTAGEFFDWLTISGLAAGLTERLRESPR